MRARKGERESLAFRRVGLEVLLNGAQILDVTARDRINGGAIVDELRADSTKRLGGELAVFTRLTPALAAEAKSDSEREEQHLDEQASLARARLCDFRRVCVSVCSWSCHEVMCVESPVAV